MYPLCLKISPIKKVFCQSSCSISSTHDEGMQESTINILQSVFMRNCWIPFSDCYGDSVMISECPNPSFPIRFWTWFDRPYHWSQLRCASFVLLFNARWCSVNWSIQSVLRSLIPTRFSFVSKFNILLATGSLYFYLGPVINRTTDWEILRQ